MTLSDESPGPVLPFGTPIFEERAFLLPEGPSIVIGDLHVGLEGELRRAGIHLPSQTFRMKQRIERLVEATGAKRLIIIGDLKHTIPTSSFQEALELARFFDGLPLQVDLVKGNHDVDMGYLPPHVTVHDGPGIRVGHVGLLHGHTWPAPEVMAAPVVLSCHNHPMVLLLDALGHRHKEPAWVRAKFSDRIREKYPEANPEARFVVMPAFNDLLGGVAFNAVEGSELLGPLFGNGMVDVGSARLYTLDGVDLGTLQDLKSFGDAVEKPKRRGRRGKTVGESRWERTRGLRNGRGRRPKGGAGPDG
ncbi:MAG TPA: metallophosphoesterase [Candidatus Thermoplasmatota archaeon]|nr:metallophosphoesterase [Candidatus Thermoplasmatota archaeon]